MNGATRNLTAVVVGFVLGSAVNMAIITVGIMIIPVPNGVDPPDMESLAVSMHLFTAQHFIFPFLAHALGTLTGALGAYFLAASRPEAMSYIVGALFLLGGIWAATMLPSPVWFLIVDLMLAYEPMALLAVFLGRKFLKA